MATLDTLKHEYDLRNASQNQPFYGSIWQNKWQSYKMLATVMTGIAKILAAANKFAHLIARLKVQVKQILESIAIVFDADLYVIAAWHKAHPYRVAHLLAQQNVSALQPFEGVSDVCDIDFYVVAAGLLAQQAAQHPNSVVKSHAVFFVHTAHT